MTEYESGRFTLDFKKLSKKSGVTEENLKKIESILLEKGNLREHLIHEEMQWFFGKLGMDRYYFETTPIDVMAKHIESLRAAEIISQNARSSEVKVDIRTERKDETFYMVEDTFEKTAELELRIEQLYDNYRLHSYRTLGKSLDQSFLRLYFISVPTFPVEVIEGNFMSNVNVEFLESSRAEAKKRYERIYEASRDKLSPYVVISQKPQSRETRIMVSLPPNTAEDFLSKFSEVMTSYGLFTTRKYLEPLRCGRRICSFYLKQIKDKVLLENLKRDISLISLLGKTPLDDLFIHGNYTAKEYLYAYCLCHFTHHFITAHTNKIEALERATEDQPELHGIVRFLKIRLAKDTFTQDRIYSVAIEFPKIIHNLYQDFRQRFDPGYHKRYSKKFISNIFDILETEVSRDVRKNIIHTFLIFNQLVLKTNFYKNEKTAVSFRVSPDILDPGHFPEFPFGIFFILSKEFQAFHVRFKDIARGGIRLVKSYTDRDYDSNLEFIFDENYRLAHTQQNKNKDIPEGGSKGAIILERQYQDFSEFAFKKYIDGILDLLMKDKEIRDYYKKQEILFLGPDEGTAPYMDWASAHAKNRGYPFWRSFTTGKSPERGGIPHDLYGITTAGVHEYELQVLKMLNINEKNATKFQTGGPDGDLGSNEIKVSESKYMAVVDGSGVVYDAAGLDRKELLRLAEARETVSHFNRNKLSREGFLVLVEDRSVKLFDGYVVANGTEFRNNFHFTKYAVADMFIPCGGRPGSINILNWQQMLDDTRKPSCRIIVEGANLFITQEARLELEKAGCIIIKDASANKGGVTSSSLEVLASLCLSDEKFDSLFSVKNGKAPAFRKKYIKEVLNRIRWNARREFGILWKENRDNGTPFAVLSDQLSDKINALTDAVEQSDLYEKRRLRSKAVKSHIPSCLFEVIDIKTVFRSVPEAYLRAIFDTSLAADFVYSHGLHTNEIDFFKYIDQYGKE